MSTVRYLLWHRIVPPGVKRVTAADPLHPQPDSLERTVFQDRLCRVFGAAGPEAASGRTPSRGALVRPDDPDKEISQDLLRPHWHRSLSPLPLTRSLSSYPAAPLKPRHKTDDTRTTGKVAFTFTHVRRGSSLRLVGATSFRAPPASALPRVRAHPARHGS